MNSTTTHVCSALTPTDSRHMAYVMTAVTTLLIAPPAVTLNAVVVFRHSRLTLSKQRKNSVFLVWHQAISDLFNVLLNCIPNVCFNIVFYTRYLKMWLPTKPSSWYCYLGTLTSLTRDIGIISSLSITIVLATDRLIATWGPNYWYTNLRYNHRKQLRMLLALIWIFACVFGAGGFVARCWGMHHVDWSYHLTRFHHVRAGLCLFLALVLLTVWCLTLFKSCRVFHRQPRWRKTSDGGSISGGGKSRSGSFADEMSKRRSGSLREEVMLQRSGSGILSGHPSKSISRNSIRVSPADVAFTIGASPILPAKATPMITKSPRNQHPSPRPNPRPTTSSLTSCLPVAMRNTSSPTPIIASSYNLTSQLKLVRVFGIMLLFFVVGYIPMLVYFIMIVREENTALSVTRQVAHGLSFLGVTLTTCLNPTIVLLRVDHFKSRSLRRKGSLTRTLSVDPGYGKKGSVFGF